MSSVRYPASKTIKQEDYTKPDDGKLEGKPDAKTRDFKAGETEKKPTRIGPEATSRYEDLPVRFREGNAFFNFLCLNYYYC